jgi:hypothetical protein
MPAPQLIDTDGHDFDTLGVSNAEYLWQLSCLIEVADARAEGRKVSIWVPQGISHVSELAHD